MNFTSAREMYEFIAAGNDLYNVKNGLYIFVYNDADALCYYRLGEDEARRVAIEAKAAEEYWGAFLSAGGLILDDLNYDKYRYATSQKSRYKYLKPSFDFCEDYYQCEGWISTDEYLDYIEGEEEAQQIVEEFLENGYVLTE